MIYTLFKDMKKLRIQQFNEALADLIFNCQNYLNAFISHLQYFKLDIRKIKDLFSMIISAEMETFDTKILCKTTFTTIYNIALLFDTDLINNLPSFSRKN